VQQASLDAARLDRDAAQAEARGSVQRVELLAAERASLTATYEDARAECKRLAGELGLEKDRCRDAIRQRDAYQEQLMRVHADARSSADHRVSDEVSRLREGSARDLDELRRTAKEAYEREIAGLRDSRAAAVAEAQRTQERLDSLQVRLLWGILLHTASPGFAAGETFVGDPPADSYCLT
jgi:chromosome segregation ATPase